MERWLPATLAFSAGAFICIALGDLLPEVQFHSHDRVRLTLLFLLGIGLAMTLENLRDRTTCCLFDLRVGIDERNVQARCQAAANGRFARAHQPDQGDCPIRSGIVAVAHVNSCVDRLGQGNCRIHAIMRR